MRHRTCRASHLVALAVALWASLSAPAGAQTTAVDPYAVVVTGDRVYLRSGAGNAWYAVGYAHRGDVLRVDGEDFGWARVQYPDTLPALVSADDADADETRGLVRLTRPTRLTARNIHGSSLTESWKRLLPQPLLPGTALKYLGELTNADTGAVEAYIVAPPNTARAFISEQFIRRASPAEVAAWDAAQRARQALARAADDAEPEPADPVPASRVAEAPVADNSPPDAIPSPGPAPGPAVTRAAAPPPATHAQAPPAQADPAPGDPAPTDEYAATDRLDTPGSATPTLAPPAARDADADADPAPTAPTPEHVNDADPAPPAPERAAPSLDDLEASFRAIAEHPAANAELDALAGEYRRLLASIPDTGASRLRRALIENRVALLEVRQEVQAQLRAIEAVSEDARLAADAIARRLDRLDRTRPYTLVGRLTASALYNGQRLPLMYRLESVEAGAGRTIAYLVPTPGLDLAGRLGSIVGVEGASRLDPALKLHIVTPTRVEALTPGLASADEPQPD